MALQLPPWLSEPYVTLGIVALFLLAAFVWPVASERLFGRFESAFASFARRKLLVCVSLFFFVILLRLALLPQLPVPNPGIHDEFSYLLMADTFSHGRLANPVHPLWRSFETFHELWHPVYVSKYPVMQGVVLALGQLAGAPWLGVLLTAAGMVSATVWMLQAWMPPRWALFAGFLMALRLCVASYWINSYWGGAVAAIGGALVLGAAGRLRHGPRLSHGVSLGLGLAILANSRPYEGLFLCIPVAAMLALLLWRSAARPGGRSAFSLRILAPATLILLPTFGFMLFYNWRITGSAATAPYTCFSRTYESAALFLWQKPGPAKHYNNATLDAFYNGFEREYYTRSLATFGNVFREKAIHVSGVFLWPACVLLLPFVVPALRDARPRFLFVALLAVVLAYCLVVWPPPHYLAPAAACLFAVLAQCIRHLRAWRPFHRRGFDRPVGRALSRAVVLALACDVALLVAQRAGDPLGWGGWGLSDRADLQDQLEELAGKHVVLMRYGPDHSVHEEWVFNGADIDSARVIWARDLPGDPNDRLFASYQDRTIWAFDPDTSKLTKLRDPSGHPETQPAPTQ